MSLKRTLSITIPKEEKTIEELIQRLRYLETPICRSTHSEEWRKQEISETTKKFKNALHVKEFFNDITKSETMLAHTDLYN
jgi:hypothetical protein